MIPFDDLLRLLDRLVNADSLRKDPAQLRRDGFGAFFLDYDDWQSFATLARIASGEAWYPTPDRLNTQPEPERTPE